MDINKVELKGRVGSVRMNEHSGIKVIHFSLATQRIYQDRNGYCINEITWHNVVAWESRYVKVTEVVKGATVHLTGFLRVSRYTAADGTEKVFTEINAETLSVEQ